uniref:Serine/threonine/tyrosine-interacting-like protein 1-like n=1 Tax=Neolamprologus brichardi TaxID=32507 RepID=A0A3Q4H4W0_NEOBR
MAKIVMCETLELYNILNQCRRVPRLAEINYLCLIGKRKSDSEGTFLLPELVEVESMRHVVVYDNNTSSLQEQGRATSCAQVFAKASLNPVKILRGGFQRFSAQYPFLRTEKILNTIMELESLKIYPVEILAGLLYMGDEKQSMDSTLLKDLKIGAIVSISESNTLEVNCSLDFTLTGVFQSLFVWSLTQEQFAMVNPTRGQKPPDNIAPGIPWTQKPLYQNKAAIQGGDRGIVF